MIAVALLASMLTLAAAAQHDWPGEGADTASAAGETPSSDTPDAVQDPPAAAPARNPVVTILRNTEISGFVDGYYAYNFNTPAKPCAVVDGVSVFNCLHAFDVTQTSFSLAAAELALEKKPTPDSRGGYRVDLDWGPATAIVAGAQGGGRSRFSNVQQAYGSILAPVSSGVRVDVGKFVTPAGREAAETKDNWNYSHSLLFALAIPHDHTGVRATYSPNSTIAMTAFFVNGWNTVAGDDGGKNIGVSASTRQIGKVTVTETYIGGPETIDGRTAWKHLSDTVLDYRVSKTTSLALNYDLGKDRNANQRWEGLAGYLKYRKRESFAVVTRYEFLNDRDGFMTGAPQTIQELTLGADLVANHGLLIRLEYRADRTNEPFFLRNSSTTVKFQSTVTAGWIYAFGSKTS